MGNETLDSMWQTAYQELETHQADLEAATDWQARARNPLTRFIAGVAVRHQERVVDDSTERLYQIEQRTE